MKYRVTLLSILAVSLITCVAHESFSNKTFNVVQEFEKTEKLVQSECIDQLAFENIRFEQKCWSLEIAETDLKDDEANIGLKLGLALQEIHNGKLDIIQSADLKITARVKADDDCSNYLVIEFSNVSPTNSEALPGTMEIAVATTELPHCDALSRIYDEI